MGIRYPKLTSPLLLNHRLRNRQIFLLPPPCCEKFPYFSLFFIWTALLGYQCFQSAKIWFCTFVKIVFMLACNLKSFQCAIQHTFSLSGISLIVHFIVPFNVPIRCIFSELFINFALLSGVPFIYNYKFSNILFACQSTILGAYCFLLSLMFNLTHVCVLCCAP